MEKITFIDMTKPRQRRPRPQSVANLASLRLGQEIVHDHRPYRTTMSLWIAKQRQRLARPFQYKPLNGKDGRYLVWISAGQSQGALPGRRRVTGV